MNTPQFPKEIKWGSASVIIYKTPSKGYVNYTLVYYQDGCRKHEYGADYSATEHAKAVASGERTCCFLPE
jgi:hypothetical protein